MLPFLLAVALLALAAWAGGQLARLARQPAVLGEVLAGVALAPGLLGGPMGLPDPAGGGVAAHGLELLATLGAVLLLFEVGLGTRLAELRAVGASAGWVAAIGIAASLAAGAGASLALAAWLSWAPAGPATPPWLLHLFVGAALTATSVGITVRVLRDLGKLATPEARVVLGAAVLDDIGGLLVLALVSTLVATAGAFDGGAVAGTLALALLFLAAAAAILVPLAPRAFDRLAPALPHPLLAAGLMAAFAVAVAAGAAWAGLAAIVGAFVAGLALAPAMHAGPAARWLRLPTEGLSALFFLTLGLHVDAAGLGGHGLDAAVAGLALAAVAVLAKLAAGLGVVRRQADRLVVGVGMVPRGEVGLVFAAVGLSSGLLAGWQYTVLLLVVLATTVATPPWLAALRGRFAAA